MHEAVDSPNVAMATRPQPRESTTISAKHTAPHATASKAARRHARGAHPASMYSIHFSSHTTRTHASPEGQPIARASPPLTGGQALGASTPGWGNTARKHLCSSHTPACATRPSTWTMRINLLHNRPWLP